MSDFRAHATTSARRWRMWTAGTLPFEFEEGQVPKAIFLNDPGNVVLEGDNGNQVTFTPAVGVPIQLSPKILVSTTATAIICLFD